MKLEEIQRQFFQSIVAGTPQPLWQFLHPAMNLKNASAAMRVYQDGYQARLSDALGETFEAVWTVVGDEKFVAICKEFISDHLSSSYNLNEYGVDVFPEFLKTSQWQTQYPFLSELARFEVGFHKIFHLAASIEAGPKEINIKESSCFEFNSTTCLFKFTQPIFDIWNNTKNNTETEIDLSKTQFVLMYRFEEQVYIKELQPSMYQLLSFLQNGTTLAKAFENLPTGIAINHQELSDIFRLARSTFFMKPV